MKIDEQEIMQSAKRLSEKENSMLCVKPWRRRRMSVPGWLVFVPAAAIIGFVFGIFVGEKQSPAAMPVMAKADTVYIKQLERVTEYDTIYRTLPSETKKKDTKRSGMPVSKDNIPYHLLVMQ